VAFGFGTSQRRILTVCWIQLIQGDARPCFNPAVIGRINKQNIPGVTGMCIIHIERPQHTLEECEAMHSITLAE
jgi:hypothetical protein